MKSPGRRHRAAGRSQAGSSGHRIGTAEDSLYVHAAAAPRAHDPRTATPAALCGLPLHPAARAAAADETFEALWARDVARHCCAECGRLLGLGEHAPIAPAEPAREGGGWMGRWAIVALTALTVLLGASRLLARALR